METHYFDLSLPNTQAASKVVIGTARMMPMLPTMVRMISSAIGSPFIVSHKGIWL
jgi:hypothetical protein